MKCECVAGREFRAEPSGKHVEAGTARRARPRRRPGPLADDPLSAVTSSTPTTPARPRKKDHARARLDGTLVHGLAWTGVVRWSSHILTWAATILVARILAPEDFGLWAMAGVYFGVVNLLTEFGLGASVIMLRDLTDEQVAQINAFALLMGTGALAVSFAMAWPLAAFFRAPQLVPVILVMAVVFPITAFRIVPAALLQKELRFKALALVDGARVLTQSLALVTFALLGLRYWALVLAALVSQSVWTALAVGLRRHRFALPRLHAIREAITFSVHVIVARLSWYLYSHADFLVAGRVLGKAQLGAYSMAWSLANVPIEKVSTLVNSVTPGFFSAVQKDRAGLQRYLLTLTEGIALIVFPAALGLALVADDFVTVVLGAHWEGAVVPLRLLAAYATIRAISPLLMPLLNAIGETRLFMWNNILGLLLLPPAFLIGSRWGTGGIAAAWIVVHPFLLLVLYARTFRRIGLRPLRYFAALWPALSAALAMTAAVLAARALLPPAAPRVLDLAAEVGAGALAYITVLFAFHRHRVDAFRRAIAAGRAAARNEASHQRNDPTP
jgi:PST family polysaccharide transporter